MSAATVDRMVVLHRYIVLAGTLLVGACGTPTTSSDQAALQRQCAFGDQGYGSGCGSGSSDAGIAPDSGSDTPDDGGVDADPNGDGGTGSGSADAGVGGDAGAGIDGGGGGGGGSDAGAGGDGGGGSGGGLDAGVGGGDGGITDGGAGDDGGTDGGPGDDGGTGDDGGAGSNSCGDGTCGPGESCDSCPDDCGACPSCGDGTCNGGESCSTCPDDCGDCTTQCSGGSGDDPEDCKNVLQVFEETSESDRPDPSCTQVAQWLTADDFDSSAISTDYFSLESSQEEDASVDPYEIRSRLFDGSLDSFNMVSIETGQTVCSFVSTWDRPIKDHWTVETPPLTPADNSSFADDPCDNGWQYDPFDCAWEEETLLEAAGGIPPQDTSDNPVDPDYIIEVDP